jgi:diguanylate cyclase (GGDEF)-like protein
VVDLDRFKEVNDRFGHGTGDDLLRWCARRLLEAAPSGSTVARLGGDEFALLLRGAGADEARAVARRVAVLGDHPVPVGVHRVRVGASVGVAVAARTPLGTGEAITGSELLRQADTAMYLAKGLEGRVAVYDDEADRHGRERALLAVELQDALGADHDAAGPAQFVVHYQPQLSIASGEVVGAEALVRWQHPRLGLLAPDLFLDLLEERGHMGALTAHVLATAVEQSRRWREQGAALRLSVNLSTSCLTDPDLLPTLERVLRRSGTAPADLVLEVTETTLMEDPAVALRTCERIAALGVGLSIDDYGTGYSSLAYLADLPATELKLDRSFTDRAVADPRIAAIVAGTVTLGHALGLRVVAEGVENLPTLDLLRRLGCDESQGFLHCRPVAAGDFSRWAAAGAVVAREPA